MALPGCSLQQSVLPTLVPVVLSFKPVSVLAVTPALEAHLSKLEAPSRAWSNLMTLPKTMVQQRLPFPFSPSSNRLAQAPHHYSWKKPAGAPWFPTSQSCLSSPSRQGPCTPTFCSILGTVNPTGCASRVILKAS